MKLIYESTGTPVEIGDEGKAPNSGQPYTVVGFQKARMPYDSGRVIARITGACDDTRWFPGVIGAVWEHET
jgi:hypothetical protein